MKAKRKPVPITAAVRIEAERQVLFALWQLPGNKLAKLPAAVKPGWFSGSHAAILSAILEVRGPRWTRPRPFGGETMALARLLQQWGGDAGRISGLALLYDPHRFIEYCIDSAKWPTTWRMAYDLLRREAATR